MSAFRFAGAEDDLKSVTDLAYKQIRQFGMNERVGHLSFNFNSDDPYYRAPYSQNLKKIMDEEVQNLIQRAYQTTKEVVEKYWTQVDKVSEEPRVSISWVQFSDGQSNHRDQTSLWQLMQVTGGELNRPLSMIQIA